MFFSHGAASNSVETADGGGTKITKITKSLFVTFVAFVSAAVGRLIKTDYTEPVSSARMSSGIGTGFSAA